MNTLDGRTIVFTGVDFSLLKDAFSWANSATLKYTWNKKRDSNRFFRSGKNKIKAVSIQPTVTWSALLTYKHSWKNLKRNKNLKKKFLIKFLNKTRRESASARFIRFSLMFLAVKESESSIFILLHVWLLITVAPDTHDVTVKFSDWCKINQNRRYAVKLIWMDYSSVGTLIRFQ